MSPTRDEFIGFIADRFQECHATPLHRDVAVTLASSCLQVVEQMEEPFGHPSMWWDQDAAHSIADDEIQTSWETAA